LFGRISTAPASSESADVNKSSADALPHLSLYLGAKDLLLAESENSPGKRNHRAGRKAVFATLFERTGFEKLCASTLRTARAPHVGCGNSGLIVWMRGTA